MSILLRIRHHQEAALQAKIMVQLARETDPDIQLRPSSDDRNQRLRGIPAIGRNVNGAIAGSDPEFVVR